MTIVTHARQADSIQQLAGREAPGGSVLYTCAGANEHGKKCGKLLGIWKPPVVAAGERAADHGSVEIKCRRCKTLNSIPLDTDLLG